jgi:hypothetical protein
MKYTLLTLILGTFTLALTSCSNGDGISVPGNGAVKVHNTHDSNYRVTINNVVKGTVSGYGTTAAYEYPDGTSISVYALQLDGYILYPSEFNGYGTIEDGQTITVNF